MAGYQNRRRSSETRHEYKRNQYTLALDPADQREGNPVVGATLQDFRPQTHISILDVPVNP